MAAAPLQPSKKMNDMVPVEVVGTGARAMLRPIERSDVDRVGRFLNVHLNSRISARRWAEAMVPGWQAAAPNHGFMLVTGEEVVGAQLAFYAERHTDEGPVKVCNIAAFCVRPEYRAQSLLLLRAILAQPGYSFTDLSPSGNVPSLNARLGFQHLDTASALVVNAASMLSIPRAELITEPEAIAASLTGQDYQIYRDHQAAQAAHHLLLRQGERRCHVIFRRDRRKNLALFATILHASDPELFAEARGQVFRHLLFRHRLPFTLLELRLVRHRPPGSLLLARHRPKMFRSNSLEPQAIDYLYSELTCVAW